MDAVTGKRTHIHVCTDQTMICCQRRIIKTPVVQIIICSIEVPSLKETFKKHVRPHSYKALAL